MSNIRNSIQHNSGEVFLRGDTIRRGLIVHYNKEKGYGFIKSKSLSHYFNVESIPKANRDKIKLHAEVTFSSIMDNKGHRAFNIVFDEQYHYYEPYTYFIKSKTGDTRGGKVLYRGKDVILESHYENKGLEELFKQAHELGFNAALNIKETRVLKSDGYSNSSFYLCKMTPAFVGVRKSTNDKSFAERKNKEVDKHIKDLSKKSFISDSTKKWVIASTIFSISAFVAFYFSL